MNVMIFALYCSIRELNANGRNQDSSMTGLKGLSCNKMNLPSRYSHSQAGACNTVRYLLVSSKTIIFMRLFCASVSPKIGKIALVRNGPLDIGQNKVMYHTPLYDLFLEAPCSL